MRQSMRLLQDRNEWQHARMRETQYARASIASGRKKTGDAKRGIRGVTYNTRLGSMFTTDCKTSLRTAYMYIHICRL